LRGQCGFSGGGTACGIAFLPEERKTEGIFLGLGVATNISLSIVERLQRFGIIDRTRERAHVADSAHRVDLAERFVDMQMASLSGGNQQKALLARVLLSGARVLVLFDPTRGVDVGTKQVIYNVVREFARDGGSVLIYSTELAELVQLVDRCLVMDRGCIVAEVPGEALSEAKLVALASGHGTAHRARAESKSAPLLSRTLVYLSKKGTLVAAAVFAALFGIYATHQLGALTLSSLTDLCNNALPLALAAAGGTFVVLTRGFDLSVAGVVSLSNVLMATALGTQQWTPLLALAMVVAVGIAVGAVNGFLVAYLRLQSVAVTLATMIVCSGIALVILETPGGSVPDIIADGLTGVTGGSVPVAALIAAVVALLWLALRRTNWGVALYAVGADETAAELAGVSTRRVKLLAYILAGVLYALAGYALSALTASGDPNAGKRLSGHGFFRHRDRRHCVHRGPWRLIGSIIGAGNRHPVAQSPVFGRRDVVFDRNRAGTRDDRRRVARRSGGARRTAEARMKLVETREIDQPAADHPGDSRRGATTRRVSREDLTALALFAITGLLIIASGGSVPVSARGAKRGPSWSCPPSSWWSASASRR
jgi:ribose transport system permease protein